MSGSDEEALAACEERLRALLELTADGYWELDERFRITHAAGGFVVPGAFPLETMLGKTPWELERADVRGVDWLAHRAQLARHEPFRGFEHALRNDAGELLWLSASGYPVFDPATARFTGYRGISRDITRRKLDERALRESEARLRLALRVGGTGVCVWAVDEERMDFDDRQRALFGFPDTAGPLTRQCVLEKIHPDDRTRVVAAMQRTVERRDHVRVEFRVLDADGTVRWLRGACDVFEPDAEGMPTRAIGVAVDITERKRAEMALEVSRRSLEEANAHLLEGNATLERRVLERGAELASEVERHAATQAVLAQAQRIESIGQLAGGVAHDFNNLLAVIGGSLELIEPYLPEHAARELLADARDAVASGASLNRQLLAFARRRALVPSRLAVNERVRVTARLLERTLGEHIALRLALEPDVRDAFADPAEFDTALVNLAVNARDAMPAGGELIIGTRNRVIEASGEQGSVSSRAGVYVELVVSDTGTGMSPAVLEQAIEPFFTTKGVGKGTGLGLSSVHGFAAQSDGALTIESRVDEGTEVVLRLPSVGPVATGKEVDAARPTFPPARGELILVVEDDPAVRRLTLRRLRALGYDTLDAASGPEALQRLESDAPIALVFSDVVMPGGMNGHELVRWVRSHRPGVSVLLTSGYNAPTLAGNACGEHDTPLLGKPYTQEELERALHLALESRRHGD